MSLHELLARVKAASEPDRELDAAIWLALTPGATRRSSTVKSSKGLWPDYTIDETREASGALVAVPAYTASIDAAVALIERALPGWVWSYHPEAGAAVWDNDFLGPVRSGRGDAETPALALIAAMLQAKIAEDKP